MFKSPILFIVGAGASKEPGLPIGSELKEEIAQRLNVEYDEFGRAHYDLEYSIYNALQEHVNQYPGVPGGVGAYQHAAGQIHKNVSLFPSIDNFIYNHRGNEKIELCSKLAITTCILDAEKKSKLYYDHRKAGGFSFDNLNETWYNIFWHLLTENLDKSQVDNIFDNISFIIFNYDRCVEQFLLMAICSLYGLEEMEAVKILKKVKIFHPYGTVGKLPWQSDQQVINFGEKIEDEIKLLQVSQQIKTFIQRREDTSELNAMRQLITSSKAIVFLGFAFNEQNMKLIKPTEPSNVAQVFATARGISKEDCGIIERQLFEFFTPRIVHNSIKLDYDLTCFKLLNVYRRSLSPL